MSKSRTGGSKPSNTAKSVHKELSHLGRICAARAVSLSKKRTVIGLLILLALVTAWQFTSIWGIAKLAGLYIYADNGKKSGRWDGNVYMRDGRTRGFTVPSLVQNGYTTAQRAILSAVSSSWNGLTQAQMETWINAEGFSRSNRLGQTFALKGKNLYTAFNANLVMIGGAPIQAAPLSQAIDGITNLVVTTTAAGGIVSMAFTPTPTDALVDHLVFATTQMSAGRFRPSSSSFRLIGTIPGATASPAVLTAEYALKFGALVAGRKVFFKLVPVHNISGQAGAAIVAQSIVA